MGLIINDTLKLSIGIEKSQCFFNISNEPIILNKNVNNRNLYNVSVLFCIYYDQESYIRGGVCIDKIKKTISVSAAEIEQNLYDLLYTKLKIDYVSYINT